MYVDQLTLNILENTLISKIIKYRETTPPLSLLKAAAMLFAEVT